jgi:hypothetical protein
MRTTNRPVRRALYTRSEAVRKGKFAKSKIKVAKSNDFTKPGFQPKSRPTPPKPGSKRLSLAEQIKIAAQARLEAQKKLKKAKHPSARVHARKEEGRAKNKEAKLLKKQEREEARAAKKVERERVRAEKAAAKAAASVKFFFRRVPGGSSSRRLMRWDAPLPNGKVLEDIRSGIEQFIALRELNTKVEVDDTHGLVLVNANQRMKDWVSNYLYGYLFSSGFYQS